MTKVSNEGGTYIATWQVGGRVVLTLVDFIKVSNKLSEWKKLAKHS